MSEQRNTVIINGREVATTSVNGKPALNIGESADYLGISETALNNVLRRWNKNNTPEIIKRKLGFGQQRYLWIEDLERLREGRPAT